MGTKATRSNTTSVDTTLAANITATQNSIPVASTTNFSTSVVAEIETTNEVVSFDSITTNLLSYSEQFDNNNWSKGRQTVDGNAGVAPDGTTTADNSIPNSGAQSNVILYKNINAGTADRTLSIFAKPNGFDFISVIFQAGASNSMGVMFNVSTGVVVASSNATGTITDAGNGWYRCSVSPTTTTSASFAIFGVSDGGTPGSYFNTPVTGDGIKGVLIWGAQLEKSALTGYLPTTTASLSGLTTVTRGVNGTTAASASSGASIQQLPFALTGLDIPIRLKGLTVSSDGSGAGRLTLCDNKGDTLFDVDVPDDKLFELSFEGGVLFPNGIFVSNTIKITAYTLYTDFGGTL